MHGETSDEIIKKVDIRAFFSVENALLSFINVILGVPKAHGDDIVVASSRVYSSGKTQRTIKE